MPCLKLACYSVTRGKRSTCGARLSRTYIAHRFMFSQVHEVLFGVDDGFFDEIWGGVNHVPEVLDGRGMRVCLRAAETQARTAAYTGRPAPAL